MHYRCKIEENGIKVQTAARQVYALLKNLCRLFLRRRKVMALKVKTTGNVSSNVRWTSYLIRRLPGGTVNFNQIHELMKPPDLALPNSNTSQELIVSHKKVQEESKYLNDENRGSERWRSSIPPQHVLDAEFTNDCSKTIRESLLKSTRNLNEMGSRDLFQNKDQGRTDRRSSIPPAKPPKRSTRSGPVIKSQRMHRDVEDENKRQSKSLSETRYHSDSDHNKRLHRSLNSENFRHTGHSRSKGNNLYNGDAGLSVHDSNYTVNYGDVIVDLEEVKL